jgi:hypothetical protein
MISPRKWCLLSLVFLFPFLGYAQSTDEFNLDEVYEIDTNGTISLQSDDAQVSITGSDRSDVRVIVNYKREVRGFTIGDGNRFEMIVEERGGNLAIYEKERGNGNRISVGSVEEDYEIRIEAPRTVSLNIEGDDETYRISSIDGAISLEADDTEIELNDCNGDDFTFSMDDGSLSMDKGKGRLKLDIDDGDVRILNGDFREIEAVSDDSEIELTTRLDDQGSYSFDFDDGDLELNIAGGGGDFDIRHDNADISADREFEEVLDDDDRSIYRLLNGNAKISISTDDGNIDLRVI